MQKSIIHNLFFSQPPAEVWEYLTRPELIALWLMRNDFEPVVGHQFNFWTNPLPKYDFDGVAYCTVLEVEPYKKLSYSWKGGPGDGVLTLDSLVEWTLEAKDNGTELHLVHSGFKETGNLLIFNAMNDGWIRNMHKIADHLNAKNNDATNA